MPVWLSLSVLKDIVLTILALYGAVLSSVNCVQAVRKERRTVVVKATTGIPTYGSELGDCFAKIEAINGAHRAVTVSTLAFELPGGQRLFSMAPAIPGISDTQLPITLADGESAHLYMSYKEIGRALISYGKTAKIKLTPVCVDSVGTTYKGEQWNVNPQEFLTM